ncbi:twin-arginine translocase subunit TatC [Gammaproteobacteria bacterium]|jgi:sec-independent protein translocase protein TatC|nr:twin-arginine translocase subunit TatC [Gammaproteobacteria bacterium]|tara:strand:- start:328 stop:1083 length:756 start_codon:yes stop_codon:yes gene_type:complete
MTNINSDTEQPLISHLIELRVCALRSIICVFVILVILLPFSNQIYAYIATPLIDELPKGSHMIATEVASPFFAPFKLTLFCAIFITVPYILYQAWSFISPGLYKNEKQFTVPLLISSSLLFYIGVAFAYYVVFPLLFSFLTVSAPKGVQVMTDINHYLNFVIKLFFAFGLSFEIPVATFLLVRTGFISVEKLAANRPYIIVSAFFIGMLLTPPDIISQILLAVPIWLLFEIGLIISHYYENKISMSDKPGD